MKIGIVSDIHSNITAFRTALDRLTGHSVERILCAGDLVNGGQTGDEVVALVKELNIDCVRGNHDEDACEEQAFWQSRNFAQELQAHLYLRADTLDFVSSLPIRRDLVLANKRICLAHGAPWSNRTYIWPESEVDVFKRVVTEAQADIVVLGHTHLPMCHHIEKTWIINTGSVDQNRLDGRQTFGVLDLANITVTIYDLATNKPIRTCGED